MDYPRPTYQGLDAGWPQAKAGAPRQVCRAAFLPVPFSLGAGALAKVPFGAFLLGKQKKSGKVKMGVEYCNLHRTL